MYQSEIEFGLFPERILKTLPDPILLLTGVYVDEYEKEWIFCIAAEVCQSTKWLHAICLRDGSVNKIKWSVEVYNQLLNVHNNAIIM